MNKYIILFLTILSYHSSLATGASGTEDYKLTLLNKPGDLAANETFYIIVNKDTIAYTSNEKGVANIKVQYYYSCVSGKRALGLLLSRKRPVWYPKNLTIIYNGKTINVKKNWNKHYKKKPTEPDQLDLSTGKLI